MTSPLPSRRRSGTTATPAAAAAMNGGQRAGSGSATPPFRRAGSGRPDTASSTPARDLEAVAAPGGSADDDRWAWVQQVRRAVTQLTPLQTETIRLVYEHHLTQAEVAAHLQVSADTVKINVAAALRHLGQLLTGPASAWAAAPSITVPDTYKAGGPAELAFSLRTQDAR